MYEAYENSLKTIPKDLTFDPRRSILTETLDWFQFVLVIYQFHSELVWNSWKKIWNKGFTSRCQDWRSYYQWLNIQPRLSWWNRIVIFIQHKQEIDTQASGSTWIDCAVRTLTLGNTMHIFNSKSYLQQQHIGKSNGDSGTVRPLNCWEAMDEDDDKHQLKQTFAHKEDRGRTLRGHTKKLKSIDIGVVCGQKIWWIMAANSLRNERAGWWRILGALEALCCG